MMARILRSPLPGFLLIALLWWLMVPALHVNPRYLPSLGAVAADWLSVWRDLLASLWHTLAETVLGFLLGCLFGIGGGILFAASRWLERGLLPLFVALQSVPVIAFGAIVVIWCGNGLLSKVVIALFLSFFPITVSTLRGLQGADAARIALLESFGASRLKIFLRLQLPTALPGIMIGLKVGIALALSGAIVGEWFGDTVGLGVMLLQALYVEQVVRVWVLIITSGLLGTLLYGALALMERKFVWWRAA